jgi:hypothetical protein
MTAFLLGITLAAAADRQQRDLAPDPPAGRAPVLALDGQWTVVHAEVDGRKLGEAGGMSATIAGNVLTFSQDGRQRRLRLEFGPSQTLRAVPASDELGGTQTRGAADRQGQPRRDELHGVYIASREIFCVSLFPGRGSAVGGTRPMQPALPHRLDRAEQRPGKLDRSREEGVQTRIAPSAGLILVLRRQLPSQPSDR